MENPSIETDDTGFLVRGDTVSTRNAADALYFLFAMQDEIAREQPGDVRASAERLEGLGGLIARIQVQLDELAASALGQELEDCPRGSLGADIATLLRKLVQASFIRTGFVGFEEALARLTAEEIAQRFRTASDLTRSLHQRIIELDDAADGAARPH